MTHHLSWVSRVLLIGSFCSNILLANQFAPFIFGGEELKPDDPLYQSAPSLHRTGRLGCSSVIIDEDIILTAAHCMPGGPFELHFSGNVESEGPYRSLKRIETHPEYDQGTQKADLAVGLFKGGLPPGYRKMKIAGNDVGHVGDEATLVGFGTSVQGQSNEGNGILRKAQVVTSHFDPNDPWIGFDQSHGKGACYGDSGGPAVMQQNGAWVIVGIASYVDPDDCSKDVFYTRPAYYLNWLKGAIERLRKE